MGWWYLLPASDHPDLPTCHPVMAYRSSLSSSPPLSSWLIFSFNQIPNRIHVHVLMSEWIRWLKATAINQEGCERSCDQDRCWKVRSSIKMRSQNKKNASAALKLYVAQNHPVPCRGRARACQSWLREGFLSIRTSSGPRAGNSRPSSSRFLWDWNCNELKIQNIGEKQTQHVLHTVIIVAKHVIMGHKSKNRKIWDQKSEQVQENEQIRGRKSRRKRWRKREAEKQVAKISGRSLQRHNLSAGRRSTLWQFNNRLYFLFSLSVFLKQTWILVLRS